MSSGKIRDGWAGSMITATRFSPVDTSGAPCSTTQVPPRERTRATATPPSPRAARAATVSTAVGSRPASASPSGSSASQRSTPGVAECTS
jgi:hypothetical protein